MPSSKIAAFGEDDVAGQQRLSRDDVVARPLFGLAEPVECRERFGHRRTCRSRGAVELEEGAPHVVDEHRHARRPECVVLTGRDVGVQRRLQVPERLDGCLRSRFTRVRPADITAELLLELRDAKASRE